MYIYSKFKKRKGFKKILSVQDEYPFRGLNVFPPQFNKQIFLRLVFINHPLLSLNSSQNLSVTFYYE